MTSPAIESIEDRASLVSVPSVAVLNLCLSVVEAGVELALPAVRNGMPREALFLRMISSIEGIDDDGSALKRSGIAGTGGLAGMLNDVRMGPDLCLLMISDMLWMPASGLVCEVVSRLQKGSASSVGEQYGKDVVLSADCVRERVRRPFLLVVEGVVLDLGKPLDLLFSSDKLEGMDELWPIPLASPSSSHDSIAVLFPGEHAACCSGK
jgi:hypothetical protein